MMNALENFAKHLKCNHNTLAVYFGFATLLLMTVLVYRIPEIGIAPEETTGRTVLKLATYFIGWTLSLRFLGGWGYSVTTDAKTTRYGMTAIACSIIIGVAIVVAGR